LKKLKHENLVNLFQSWSGEEIETLTSMPQSGSYREYYRITGKLKSAVGVFNEDKKENQAFLSFSQSFLSANLPVPEIYEIDQENDIYLQQDLGDTTLFSFLSEHRNGKDFTPEIISMYEKVLEGLPDFQINGSKKIDYSVCYPRSSFDKQSMMWDLNYFKYYFLKLAKIPFDEQNLEDDFQLFSDYLLQADSDYFLYRDFQSRNIMIQEGMPYFIDYQGGRKGALQYDLASLVFDSKAEVPDEVRIHLQNHYLKHLKKHIAVNENEFLEYYYGFVLIRLLQAMGAFGFRGFYEKKTHFLQSIPSALVNLRKVLDLVDLPVELPELFKVLHSLPEAPEMKKFKDKKDIPSQLKIKINSFSYRKGIPVDPSGNGGGYVFDCRAVHNPGRYEQFKTATGKDDAVIAYMKKETEMDGFMQNVFALVDQSVDKYLQRQFTNLMVSFGCTGGQHRSVYAAESLYEHLMEKYNIEIEVRHIELEKLKLKAKV